MAKPSLRRRDMTRLLTLLLLFLLRDFSFSGGINLGHGRNMFAEAQYVYPDQPTKIWSRDLPDTGSSSQPGIRRGNAVRISPDDALVYVTLSDGTLHTLNPQTGTTNSSHTVQPWNTSWTVECKSGVFFSLSNRFRFAVYAIADIPPAGSTERVHSRVVAVDHPTGRVLFTSSPFPGRISGTPVVTSDGLFVLITRNTEDDTVGHFTILSVLEKGKVKYTEASDQFKAEDKAPFGAPGIVYKPERGMFDSGTGNTNDVVLWVDSTDFGRADDGLTRGFQFPSTFNGIDFTNVRTVRLRIVGFTSTNAPIFSKDGLNVFFTGTRSGVRSWIKQDFGGPITWKSDLARKKNDGLQPIYSAASMDHSETKLFVGSAGSTFVSLNVTNGGINWEETNDSVVLVAPILSPDDKRVYCIETYGGNVRSFDSKRGTPKWSINCQSYLQRSGCFNAGVEGEFSMSSDGYNIYFGNLFGTVTALSVSFLPTANPTVTPTTAIPTVSPTQLPTTLSPTPIPSTASPTTDDTKAPTITYRPTVIPPTSRPTKQPTVEPSLNPIPPPTLEPMHEVTTTDVANLSSGASVRCAARVLYVAIAAAAVALLVSTC